MATVTKPIVLDETLQATNTALGSQNSKMDTLNTKLQAIADAIADSSVIGDTDISEIADGTLTGAVAQFDEDISGLDTDKADKVDSATNGNLAGLNDSGNLTDSGISGDMTTTSASGNPISIANLKSAQIAKNPIITFEPIQAGSGTPSPSNIRAISGYDKIEVLSVGKNVLPCDTIESGTTNGLTHTVYKNQNGEVEKIVVNGKATAVSEIVVQLPLQLKNGEYILSGCPSGGGISSFTLDYLNTSYSYSRDTGSGVTFTVNDDAYYVRIRWFDTTNTYSNIEFKPMIRLSSVLDATYTPYHKTTDLSESLGQTVYGGTLNLRSGKLTVTKQIIDLGNLTWEYAGNNYGYANISSKKIDSTYIVSSYFTPTSVPFDGSQAYDLIKLTNVNQRVFLSVNGTSYGSGDTIKAYAQGKYIVYELATPFTIQLTPHEIALSQGYNYISTNGTSISLAYHNGELASLSDVAQVGETVNELGEYVGANKGGATVDLSPYNDISKKFEVPYDGYVNLSSNGSTTGYVRAVATDKNGKNLAYAYMNVTGSYQIQSLFVKKGMFVWSPANTVTNATIEYIPLVQ